MMQVLPNLDASPRFDPDRTKPFSVSTTGAAKPAGGPIWRPLGLSGSSPVQAGSIASNSGTVAEQLYTAKAGVKIWTSRLAMHLDKVVRDRLFRQIDMLHDLDEWGEGDAPVDLESYKGLVRAILLYNIRSRPFLSLMPGGNILAIWEEGKNKLSVEFLSGNKARWIVQNELRGEIERAAGVSPLERLREVLRPYAAGLWFNGC